MPKLPDIPGKGLVRETTERVRSVAGAAGTGALTVGGLVAKRVLGGKVDEERGANADPIAQTPTAPPAAETKPVPSTPSKAGPRAPKPKAAPAAKPKPAPKAATPKAKPAAPAPKVEAKPKVKPAAPKPKSAAKADPAPKPKPAKPKPKAAKPAKPAKAKAPKATGTDAPAKPSVEPGNISGDKEPHHALNNPVRDPDATEYPDPFDKREDPRDPADPDGKPFGEEPHSPTGAESTSEPPLSQDPTVPRGGKPPQRDKLDE